MVGLPSPPHCYIAQDVPSFQKHPILGCLEIDFYPPIVENLAIYLTPSRGNDFLTRIQCRHPETTPDYPTLLRFRPSIFRAWLANIFYSRDKARPDCIFNRGSASISCRLSRSFIHKEREKLYDRHSPPMSHM